MYKRQGLGGLVVDRYADVLSLEVSTLAVWQRLDRWLPLLHRRCGTKRHVVQVDEGIARMEGIRAVSYTHLDVYKRQAYSLRVTSGGALITAMDTRGFYYGMKDVYKRQTQGFRGTFQGSHCLLFRGRQYEVRRCSNSEGDGWNAV